MSNADGWVTKQEAAATLGVAEKTVDRMAAKGKIQKATRKRPGQPNIAVFHPGDLERIKAEREQSAPAPFVVPELAQPQVSSALITALTAIADRVANPELKEPFFLTLKQARETSGLSMSFLRREFAVKTGGSWRIRRAELEQFGRDGHTSDAPVGRMVDMSGAV